MILFLYGEDNFRSLQKLNAIVARYQRLHKTGLNLKPFDLERDSFEDFRDQFQTRSIFKEKKFFILKNVCSNSLFKEKFKAKKDEFLKSDHIILFYEKKSPPEKDSFFIFLKKVGTSQEFKPLQRKGLESWIKNELTGLGAKMENDARELLIERVGNNLWQLSNDLKKLLNYKRGQKRITITKEDVELLVHQRIELNIFKTIDFIARAQKQKAIFLLQRHIRAGDSPLYLLAMINFQFRNLLILKQISQSRKNLWSETKKLGLHPFVVRKGLGLCQRFTFHDLKKIYEKLFQLDIDIKSGRINPELALDLLVSQI